MTLSVERVRQVHLYSDLNASPAPILCTVVFLGRVVDQSLTLSLNRCLALHLGVVPRPGVQHAKTETSLGLQAAYGVPCTYFSEVSQISLDTLDRC